MPFFQSIEMNCQLSDILNWCLMIFKFCKHNICFSLFSLLLLFYNIHFLPGLPLIYWKKLLLLSTQVLLHEIVSIHYKVWVDWFTWNLKGNTSRFGYAIQVLPSGKTIISKQNSIKKFFLLIPIKKKLLNYIFLQNFCW